MISYILNIIIVQIVLSLLIIFFSRKLKLLDIPDNRKLHLEPTAYTGGIILCLVYISIVFLTNYENKYFNLVLSYGFLISFAGFLDDKYKFNPGTKLISQIFPIYLIVDQGLYLVDLGEYNLFGSIILGSFDKIFTILCCLFLINACNYSDGIDGLLPSIGATIFLFLSFFSLVFTKNTELFAYIIVISLPLIVFLCFNFGIIKNYKVFLGDSGSNLIGFLISFIIIYLYRFENIHPAVIIWPIAYLVYEFISVNLLRLINSKKIFKPGRDHFHYELQYALKTNKIFILFVILILNLIISIGGYLIFKNFGPDYSIIFFILGFPLFYILRLNIRNFRR